VAFEVRQEEACKVYNCTEYSGVVTDTRGQNAHDTIANNPIIQKTLFPEP
jgi:hypothetical protein